MFEQQDQGFAFAGGRNDQSALFAEIGLRRELSNRSDLLINLEYVDIDSNNSDTTILFDPIILGLRLVAEQTDRGARETLQLQTQYSLALEKHQLNVGFVHLDGENLFDTAVNSEVIDIDDFFEPAIASLVAQELRASDQSNSVRRETDLRFSSIYIDDIWKVAEKSFCTFRPLCRRL